MLFLWLLLLVLPLRLLLPLLMLLRCPSGHACLQGASAAA